MDSIPNSPRDFLERTVSYHERLYRIALAQLQDPEEARDALHDVLLKAASRYQQFRSASHLYTWLVRILINHCHDVYRSRKRRNSKLLTEKEQLHLEQAVVPGSDVAQSYELTEESRLLLTILGKLPATYREVILLRYFEEMSYQKIAETLSLPEGTVKSRLNQARKILRNELKAAGFEESGGSQ